MSGYCRWYDKDIERLAEHEQEECEKIGLDCDDCPNLKIKSEGNGSSRMTLQEFEASGGCHGCPFYQIVEPETLRKACTFRWLDDESEDWEFSKNCDELGE